MYKILIADDHPLFAQALTKVAELEAQRDDVILLIPNIPDRTVPVGDCYDKNRIVMEHGKNTVTARVIRETRGRIKARLSVVDAWLNRNSEPLA